MPRPERSRNPLRLRAPAGALRRRRRTSIGRPGVLIQERPRPPGYVFSGARKRGLHPFPAVWKRGLSPFPAWQRGQSPFRKGAKRVQPPLPPLPLNTCPPGGGRKLQKEYTAKRGGCPGVSARRGAAPLTRVARRGECLERRLPRHCDTATQQRGRATRRSTTRGSPHAHPPTRPRRRGDGSWACLRLPPRSGPRRVRPPRRGLRPAVPRGRPGG